MKKRLVLCAYGITVKGQRELISFRQASSETEAQWEACLPEISNASDNLLVWSAAEQPESSL